MAETAVIHACDPGVISPEAEKCWRECGYALVRGAVRKEVMDGAFEAAHKIHPETGVSEVKADFGSSGEGEFPTLTSLDDVTMSEDLIAIVRKLLRCQDIRLTQSDSWAKVGTDDRSAAANADQRIHMDYGNNSFLHPSPWDEPEVVAAIVYFSDLDDTGGATAVVPRRGDDDEAYAEPFIRMPGQAGLPFINDRNTAETRLEASHPDIASFRASLYARELRPTGLKPGDVLLYRHDVWHRGTPVNPGKMRRVLNLAWRRGDAPWIQTWSRAPSQLMYYGPLEAYLSLLTPDQRSLINFPPPGHGYWTERTVRLVGARYPAMDMTPYAEAIASS